MIAIKDLVQKKVQDTKEKKEVKGYNKPYEEAKRLGDLVGCSPLIIMKLQKKHGKEKVMGLYSWFKDYPNLDKKRAVGLLYWKLKQS